MLSRPATATNNPFVYCWQVADKKGFRAKIHSNEPGLKSHYAAHAHYDVDHQGYHGGHHGGYKHDDHGYGHHNEGHHGKHY